MNSSEIKIVYSKLKTNFKSKESIKEKRHTCHECGKRFWIINGAKPLTQKFCSWDCSGKYHEKEFKKRSIKRYKNLINRIEKKLKNPSLFEKKRGIMPNHHPQPTYPSKIAKKPLKLDPVDSLFSRYIRLRDKRCVRCGIWGRGKDEIENIQASHFYGRANEGTRFHPDNVDAACNNCHRAWEGSRDAYKEWKLKQLGRERFKNITILAHSTVKKYTRKTQIVLIKALMSNIQEIKFLCIYKNQKI